MQGDETACGNCSSGSATSSNISSCDKASKNNHFSQMAVPSNPWFMTNPEDYNQPPQKLVNNSNNMPMRPIAPATSIAIPQSFPTIQYGMPMPTFDPSIARNMNPPSTSLGSAVKISDANEKRKKRLEKNRESARECRRRKREQIHVIEEKCEKLEKENLELQVQLQAGKDALKQQEEEKSKVCEDLQKMISSGASEQELAQKIHTFKEQYSDYGRGRRSALTYHLQQLEKLLLPTQVTKMCMWSLQQDDGFWMEDDETSLTAIIGKELGITNEQKLKMTQHRDTIRKLCNDLRKALNLVQELRKQVETKNESLDSEMEQLQSILTPTQAAKFILWVTNNPACMHLLNRLWKNLG